MISIILPDGSIKHYENPVVARDLAQSVGAGLARDAIAVKVNDELKDMSDTIAADAQVEIITAQQREGIEVMRHSCAHLLGHALKQLYPDVKMVIGPVVEDGFYYDVALPHPLTEEDLTQIEERMRQLARTHYEVIKKTLPRQEAVRLFEEREETYKLRLIEDMPDEQELQVYHHQEYVDMCRGPHIPSMKHIGAFKLMKLAGAYWRGDSRNEMLQRIYGTCWKTQQELQDYLERLAEAEKRDHRRLGKQLSLFHSQEEAPGMLFWHPLGTTLYLVIEEFIRLAMASAGYQEVKTPQLVDRSLWEKSGHWEKFKDMMFTTSSESREYAIKPMNCPGHVQVFKQTIHSYRELPIRYAEFGNVHRNEPSGTLHGMLRARNFTQDDAHIFLMEGQVKEEVCRSIRLIRQLYKAFGFDEIILKLSTRPEQRVGSDEDWDKAEKALMEALDMEGVDWALLPGEGAFYGPKVEFSLRDQIGRVWQCGTIQVDFSMPGRLEAQYIKETGGKEVPVMVHQAVLGSMERFMGILIEHYAGALPFWLAPEQLVVMTITDEQADYAHKVLRQLRNYPFRVKLDVRNEKIGYKIRQHTMSKIPYQIVLGNKEVAEQAVSVRRLDGTDLKIMTVERLMSDYLKKEFRPSPIMELA